MEADLVSHSGPVPAGSFAQTLTLTDIATGWTECAPLLVREQTLLIEVLKRMRGVMPFPLLGFDTDNDSVFMNETVKDYCLSENLVFTRCRPYRKNDQAWVEQKNGAVVRRAVGYRRYEGIEAAALLAQLYSTLRLFVHFFQPSFKLAEKTRDGAKVRKRYHLPATPYQRLLADPRVTDEIRRRRRRRLRDARSGPFAPGDSIKSAPAGGTGGQDTRRGVRRAGRGGHRSVSRWIAHGMARGRCAANEPTETESETWPSAARSSRCGDD